MKKLLITMLLLICCSTVCLSADTPSFPGGDEALQAYIKENLKYPRQALDNGIEGNVPLQFIVKADGSITSVKVIRMIDPDLEAEAIRLVKGMPAWVPADINGQPAEATASLVIIFRLPDD